MFDHELKIFFLQTEAIMLYRDEYVNT